METTSKPARIDSLDQFRGYTVAGMVVVNYLGDYPAIHSVFKHNNNYLSYADTIMPSFLFAAGVSYRLTTVRRLETIGSPGTTRRAVGRGFGLIFISLMLYGFDQAFNSWNDMTSEGVREFIAKLLKADLWETLAIIGACQLLVLPLIARSAMVRAGALIAFLAIHVSLTYAFNWNFVNGQPNVLDPIWGASTSRAWDGGFFGLLMWSSLMLMGTFVYDIIASGPKFGRLLALGILLMGVGWGLSCLTRLYDIEPGEVSIGEQSPVLPPLGDLARREWRSLLAEPPFVAPPPKELRAENYWMMGKRIVSLSFVLFAGGFAFAASGLFVAICDVGGLKLGLFRTFGMNPLAAYGIHHMLEQGAHQVVPKDSPLFWCLIGLAVFFGLTYFCIRSLERQGIFLRL